MRLLSRALGTRYLDEDIWWVMHRSYLPNNATMALTAYRLLVLVIYYLSIAVGGGLGHLPNPRDAAGFGVLTITWA